MSILKACTITLKVSILIIIWVWIKLVRVVYGESNMTCRMVWLRKIGRKLGQMDSGLVMVLVEPFYRKVIIVLFVETWKKLKSVGSD